MSEDPAQDSIFLHSFTLVRDQYCEEYETSGYQPRQDILFRVCARPVTALHIVRPQFFAGFNIGGVVADFAAMVNTGGR